MDKKIFYARLSKTGKTYPVTLNFTKYTNNQTLAVQLIEAQAPWSPFATITVNLPESNFGVDLRKDKKYAFVDTNNNPWVEEFLLDNEIAKPTGITGQSGFCSYPLYEFNKDAQWVNP